MKKILLNIALSISMLFVFCFAASATDRYVSTTGNDASGDGSAGNPWRTIQYAVNTSSAGDVINVAAGTYIEQVEITKMLTIVGADSTSAIIVSPSTLALSFTTSGRINKPVIYIHDANGVNIQSLTINGAGNGNNNNEFEGIAYRNAGGLVQSCIIKGIRNNPIDGAQSGVGIYALADNGTARTLNITFNTINDFQKNGTSLKGANLSTNVTSNTITGAGAISYIAQNGIQISNSATGSVSNNTVSSFCYTPYYSAVSCGVLIIGASGSVSCTGNHLNDAQFSINYYQAGGSIQNNIIAFNAANMGSSPYWTAIDAESGTTTVSGNEINNGGNGSGIEADYYSGETTNMTVINNKVDNTDEGIVIYTDGSGGTSLTSINNNSITNAASKFIHNYGSTTQNATCNWYGTFNYPVISSKISGPVNYIPYLSNGTDNSTASGFQPIPGSCNGTPKALYVNDNSRTGDRYTTAAGNDATGTGSKAGPYKTINKAMNVANPGDSIIVDAGNYPEYINVVKSLTFLGSNYDKTINYQNPTSNSSRYAESIITAQTDNAGHGNPTAFEAHVLGTTIVIKGFEIKGGRPLTDGNDQRNFTDDNDITILFEKNWVTAGDNLFCGTLTPWRNVKIIDNYFNNINKNTTSSAIQLNDANDGYAPFGSTAYPNNHPANIIAVITKNTIDNVNFAGVLLDNIGNARVDSNIITTCKGEAGIQLAGGMGNATVSYNTVYGANNSGSTVYSSDGGAIRIYGQDFATAGTFNITNNLLSGAQRNGNCFSVKINQEIHNPNIHVNYNYFGTQVVGTKMIYHGGTDPGGNGGTTSAMTSSLDAECNWYGTTNATSIASNVYSPSGSAVDFIPYLYSGTNNVGAGFPGFKPDANSCGSSTGRPGARTDGSTTNSKESILPTTFKVNVLSNPAINNFVLQVESPSNEPVQMRIVDISGKLISAYSKYSANSTITFGSNLFSGVYFAQVVQGKNHQVVKLVKLK